MWYLAGPKVAERAVRRAVIEGKWEFKEAPRINDAYARPGDAKRPKEVQEFLKMLRMNFGTVVRAWRLVLDVKSCGRVDFRQFIAGIRKIGWSRNARTLWFNLDVPQSCYVSLYELDPTAANALDRFRYRCTSQHGSMEAAFQACIDQDGSGRCSMAEFKEGARKLGYDDREAEALFQHLKLRPTCPDLARSDVTFLQGWEDCKSLSKERQKCKLRWVNKNPYAEMEFTAAADAAKAKAVPAGGDHRDVDRHRRSERSKAIEADLPGKPGASLVGWVTARVKSAAVTEEAVVKREESLTDPKMQMYREPTKESLGLEITAIAPGTDAVQVEIQLDEGGGEEAPLGEYANRVGTDGQTLEGRFLKFLLDKYENLCCAWDALEPRGLGQLSAKEFEFVIVSSIEYCRLAEARRLWQALPKQDVQRFTWRDLGVSAQEWIEHITTKKWQAQLQQNRIANAAAGPDQALQDYYDRQRKVPNIDLAFGEKPPPESGPPLPPEFRRTRPQSAPGARQVTRPLASSSSPAAEPTAPKRPLSARPAQYRPVVVQSSSPPETRTPKRPLSARPAQYRPVAAQRPNSARPLSAGSSRRPVPPHGRSNR